MAENHAEHHRLADYVEQLVAVALSYCVTVVGVSWRPRRHRHVDGEADSLNDAAHRVLPPQHALLQWRACAEASTAAKGQTDTLIGAMVHADQAGRFT